MGAEGVDGEGEGVGGGEIEGFFLLGDRRMNDYEAGGEAFEEKGKRKTVSFCNY